MKSVVCIAFIVSCVFLACSSMPCDADEVAFRTTIAPILIRNCLECHHGGEPSGGLDLTSAESFAAGGESGRVFDDDADHSLLWEKVSAGEMPPESKLDETELEVIRAWLDSGAPWDHKPLDPYELTTDKRAGYDWWSLQGIVDSPVPVVGVDVRNPIDAFILARPRGEGLSMSPRADARTLVRRLSVRLHGIHPDPATVARLEQDDSPEKFDTLVSEFLDSHRYGERWARHWLDLARFGESQGFERDKSRPNAWRYRDWVIDALNNDMPYDEFARLQIAGDCISETGRGGVIATGFLVAGAYDEVGQSQQSSAMKAVVRQDEMEDYVGTVGQTFLGLTTNCARCHDHKFDPIRQSEYYALCAALDGVRHGDREITSSDAIRTAQEKKAQTNEQIESLSSELQELERPVLAAIIEHSRSGDSATRLIARPLAHWDFEGDFEDRFGELDGEPNGDARLENGDLVVDGKRAYVITKPLRREIVEKTLSVRVTLDTLDQGGGGAISLLNTKTAMFDSVVYGEREAKRWMAGSDHFRRTKNVGGPDELEVANRPVHIAITYAADGTITLYRDGVPYGSPYQTKQQHRFGPQDVVTFGIRLLPTGGNRMLAGRIHEASLFDRVLSAEEVADLAAGASPITRENLMTHLSAEQCKRHAELQNEIDRLRAIDTTVPREFTYAVNPKQPEQPTRLLLRGNTATPGDIVAPAGLASVRGTNWDFELPADAPEAERRRKLAEWITSGDNPLFARVIVNRLWQHHFGAGFVSTPNDFGFTGGKPTHPELLDYLSARLIESNWSLKSIHRLIVTSATWQQSTTNNPDAAKLDAGNRLLWRGNRTRLDAETLRDSMLLVAGQLNDAKGGPSYQDFKTFNFNSQFYEMTDPVGDEFNRRTIYRMVIRSGRNRMLDAFDCPDPSATAPKRAMTTTPLQALSLLNHSFALRMADCFADRLATEAGDDRAAQVERAVVIAWCRSPTEVETKSLVPFADQHGLPALCRVLLNSNEFLYVD